MMCKNLLEIYQKYKITDEINEEEFNETHNKFSNLFSTIPECVLSIIGKSGDGYRSNKSNTILGVRGRFLFYWAGSWDDFEDEYGRLFQLSGGLMSCAIIEIVENRYSSLFEDCLSLIGDVSDINNYVNQGLKKIIEAQDYCGFYMPNTYNYRRSRKINMYTTLRVCKITFPEYTFNYSYSYSWIDIDVRFKDIKTGKELKSNEQQGMRIFLNNEMREKRLLGIKSRWLNSYTRDIKSEAAAIKNLTEALAQAKRRKEQLELEFKNFETTTNKILGI